MNAHAANSVPLSYIQCQKVGSKSVMNSEEFQTFLKTQPPNVLSPAVDASTSTIRMEMSHALSNTADICSLFDLTREEFFMGAFVLTLRQYVGNSSVAFGVPVSTRPANIEEADGVFNNILSIKIATIDMGQNLAEFWKLVKDEVRLSLQVKDSDFSKLDNTNIYMASYEQVTVPETGNIVPVNPKAQFHLAVTEDVNLNGSWVTLTWEKSLLDNKIAKFFVMNFIQCCQSLAKSSNILLKSLENMCPEEHRLLETFNRDLSNQPTQMSVVNIFDRNVALNPAKVAVYERNSKYTYAQLASTSKKLASALVTKFGHKKLSKTPVVLVMEKNFTCIASVLAIWRAGGYFLPIDANIQERLTGLSESEDYTCILTNLEHKEITKSSETLQIIRVIDLVESNETSDEETAAIDLEAPAYMTMTSGSTGSPKKCINSHRGIIQFVHSAAAEFNLDETTNVLQWVPFSFDVFFSDLLKSLICTNGSLTVVTSTERLEVPKIASLIASREVNYIHMTPTFALFACQEEPTLLNGVKTLCLGGEALSWKTVETLRNHLDSDAKLYNCYGLTEATIESTVYQVPHVHRVVSQCQGGNAPIGRPLPSIRVTVLDPSTMHQSPIGALGMLAISGPTVGSGDVPVVLNQGERWLLTGDTGVWLPDGNLEFKGRSDHSFIKIGGLRINCEELESVILGVYPEIEGVVALAVEIQNDVFLSVAIQTTSTSLNGRSLQENLRKLVPYYMVPQYIYSVVKFPLSANGKLDRKALKLEIETVNKPNYVHKSVENDNADQEQIGKELKNMENFLMEKFSQASGRSVTLIDRGINLRDQGFTSIQLLQVLNILIKEQLENFDGISDLFTYPTISLLAKKLISKNKPIDNPLVENKLLNTEKRDQICIVGMAFRLPGNEAGSVPDLWTNLLAGKSMVKPFPENRSEDVLTRMSEPFKGGAIDASFFDNIDGFDHEFFNIAPNEAKHMCPEQRMFLEVGTEALVDAGFNLSAIDGSNIGVYSTATEVEYGNIDTSLEGVAVVGRQSSVVPSRLSYFFNLHGGNYVVDTACSAALTALEQAVRDLRAGQCSAALVGGANLYLYPAKEGLMGTNLIHSPSSNCLPFDSRADGTVSGEGIFAYVLKRKSTVTSSDHVYATIESICSNAVGRGNGVTAPSVDSQVTVIHSALNQAGITVDEVDLLETHGTGTILGDQIELCALSTAFSSRSTPLTLGGSKHNFGHLDMAAGFLSILKATTALTLNSSPALSHIQRPSKYLDKSVFKTEAKQLRPDGDKQNEKLIAGISAYGLSGTNCHCLISVKPSTPEKNVEPKSCHFLIPVDNNRLSFEAMCGIYSRYIEFYGGLTVQDICGTQINHLLNLSRKTQKVAIFQASSLEELRRQLNAISTGITTVPQSKLQELSSVELAALSPKHWNRAPALPKCFFKKFRHWLPPVELKSNQNAQMNTLDIPHQLGALTTLLATKAKEVHALTELAHQLQAMVTNFSLNLMQDLMVNTNTSLSLSNSVPVPPSSSQNVSNNVAETKPNLAVKFLSSSEDEALTYESTYEIISKIWEDCLGSQNISESDIFRDLGGDSLLTVQMMKTVGSRFKLKLRAADAFANPTLASLSSFVFNQCSDYNPVTRSQFSGMPMKMIMFPGQGSQKVNMCESLRNSLVAMKVFQEAESITEMNILSRLSDPTAFESTEFVQVVLFVGSLAKIAQLQEDEPEVLQGIRVVGGLSAGEFAALVFAGAIEFKDALEIVRFRGKVMQEAVMESRTGMVSVFGPKKKEFENWLVTNFPDIQVSTYLGDNQFAVGGPFQSCEQLTEQLTSGDAEMENLGVIDARILRVAGAFHTEWMKSAGIETGKLIDQLNIHYPRIGIIMNADGQVAMNKDDIRFNLKKQTTSPVMWRDSMLTAHSIGIRNFVEISPSAVLCPILQKRIHGITNSEFSSIRI